MKTRSSSGWVSRPAELRDHEAWSKLFADYCAFYGRAVTERQLAQGWSWIHDTAQVRALLVTPEADPDDVCGIAHLRPWVRPLRGEVAGYLDDLFIDPPVRGDGALEALFDGIKDLAHREGWRLVRWATAEDNYRARAAYDRIAKRTDWITYDLDVGESSGGAPG